MAKSVNYAKWVLDALEANPNLSQAGLARHLGHGEDRSRVTKIIQGVRRVRLDEVPLIAAYLGTPPPDMAVTIVADEQPSLRLAGTISRSQWSEARMPRRQATVGIPARPDPRFPAGDQVSYEMGDSATSEGIREGDYLIAMPYRAVRRQPQPGDLIVTQRRRDKLEQYSLAKAVASRGQIELVPVIDGAAKSDPGQPQAVVIGVFRVVG